MTNQTFTAVVVAMFAGVVIGAVAFAALLEPKCAPSPLSSHAAFIAAMEDAAAPTWSEVSADMDRE